MSRGRNDVVKPTLRDVQPASIPDLLGGAFKMRRRRLVAPDLLCGHAQFKAGIQTSHRLVQQIVIDVGENPQRVARLSQTAQRWIGIGEELPAGQRFGKRRRRIDPNFKAERSRHPLSRFD